jgi:hypothetical protein
MLLDLFFASPWPGVLLWAALYTSDLLFTMACARLYQQGGRDRIAFEGSFEITPYYQKDVDRLRRFSPRFLLAMAATCGVQAYLWWLTIGYPMGGHEVFMPDGYLFGLGAMVLAQLTVHVRHLRNFVLFRAIVAGDGITGRIEYRRPIMLRMSAVELLAFAIVYTVIFAFTDSWFVLGGAVACGMLSLNHRLLARKAAAGMPSA